MPIQPKTGQLFAKIDNILATIGKHLGGGQALKQSSRARVAYPAVFCSSAAMPGEIEVASVTALADLATSTDAENRLNASADYFVTEFTSALIDEWHFVDNSWSSAKLPSKMWTFTSRRSA